MPQSEKDFEETLDELIEKSIQDLESNWKRTFRKENRETLRGVPSQSEQERQRLLRENDDY